MAPHIPKRAGAKVKPLAPLAWMIVLRQVRPCLGYTQPEIPVQSSRHRILTIGTSTGIAPALTAPTVNFPYLADGSSVNRSHDCAVYRMGVNLDPHLRNNPALPCGFLELASFVDCLRQWLLRVDMQSLLHGSHCDGSMHMVRRGYIDRRQILLFVEEHTPILVDSCFGKSLTDLRRSSLIYLCHRHKLHMLCWQ